jgi:hypothetical protein
MKTLLLAFLLSTSMVVAQEKYKTSEIADMICRSGVTSKFVKSPTFSIIGDAGPRRQLILDAVQQFNTTCAGLPVQIIVMPDNRTDAAFLFFADSNHIAVPMPKYDRQGNILTTATAFDVTLGHGVAGGFGGVSTWEKEIYFRILSGMGFSSSTKDLPMASFWHMNWNPQETAPSTPTELDNKVIRFLYEKVPSNTPKGHLGALIRKNF